MEVKKDGRVWSAYDKDLNLCISGDTETEATDNLNKAATVLKAQRIGLVVHFNTPSH